MSVLPFWFLSMISLKKKNKELFYFSIFAYKIRSIACILAQRKPKSKVKYCSVLQIIQKFKQILSFLSYNCFFLQTIFLYNKKGL